MKTPAAVKEDAVWRIKHKKIPARITLGAACRTIRALMASLDLPRDAFLPVVFFIGNATFKTPMPPNVLHQGLSQWLRQHQETRLDPSAVAKAVITLVEIHRSTDRKAAARAHVAAIHERSSPAKTRRR